MADDEISVELQDDAVIDVPVDGGDASLKADDVTIKKVKEKKESRKRVTLDVDVLPDVEDPLDAAPTPEDALAEAQRYAKEQEEARKAAEMAAANERALREQAQRQAQQAQLQAEQLAERASTTEFSMLESALASHQKELETLEADMERAAESGEFSQMSKIQSKMGRVAALIVDLERRKESFDSSQYATEGRVVAQEASAPAPQASSAFEQMLSTMSLRSQSWLRLHPEYAPAAAGGNQTKHNQLLSAHYKAVADGIQTDSDEYFRALEEGVGLRSQEATRPLSHESRPSARPLPLAAPPSREVPDSSNSGATSRTVRLTKDQQDMARMAFPNVPEKQAFGMYAKNLMELRAEGKIGRTTH